MTVASCKHCSNYNLTIAIACDMLLLMRDSTVMPLLKTLRLHYYYTHFLDLGSAGVSQPPLINTNSHSLRERRLASEIMQE